MQTMAMMNTSTLQQRIASPMQKPTAVRPAPLRLRSVVVRAEAPKEIQVRDLLLSILLGGGMASCGVGVRQCPTRCRGLLTIQSIQKHGHVVCLWMAPRHGACMRCKRQRVWLLSTAAASPVSHA